MQPEPESPHLAANPPLSRIMIGALCLHGEMSAADVMDRAEAMGLDTDAAARAVADLLSQKLINAAEGRILATAKLRALPQNTRIAAISAHLALKMEMANA